MKNDRTGNIAANGLRAAARTDCGRQRDGNEDRYFIDLDTGIFLVIDGVGGHAAGEVAARIAHETIQKRLERQDAPADVRIREAITLANQQILLQAGDAVERKGMACVLTLAVLEGRRVTVGHVGDTRLYRLSADGIAKMTHDHSPIGEREDAREISETEAMQHARRNEVYRDVGSEPREPDAPDFIETLVTTLEDDTALLLCSDGLSDMLPSLEINRLVRANAGDAARVADALIDAANEAGGKDNITVVYVEAPRFARTQGAARVLPVSRQAAQQVATEALAGFETTAADPIPVPPVPETQTAAAQPSGRAPRPLPSRAFLLVLGLLLGLGAALAFAYGDISLSRIPFFRTPGVDAAPRELQVGGADAGAFNTIGEALLQARDGDVIRVHPGRYAEALELRRDVTLISEQPRAAVLVAPTGARSSASVTVWAAKSRLRGFRIANEAAPGHVGVRVHAGDVEIDDMVFEGALQIGVDVVGSASHVTVRGSRFNGLAGVPVQIADRTSVMLRGNLFQARAGSKGPAVTCVSGTGLVLDANVFMHFGRTPVVAASGPPVVIDPAYVIPPPAAPRGRAR